MKYIVIILTALLSLTAYSQIDIECGTWTQQQRTDTMNTNFDSVFDKTNSWVTPEMFGADGYDSIDDASALQEMFDFARDSNKIVNLSKDAHYFSFASIIYCYGVVLNGNNATIESLFDGAGTSTTLAALGNAGAYYSVDSSIGSGSDVIYINNSTFLNTIKIGDMIKIKSDKDFSVNLGITQGETQIISSIHNDTIYIAGKFSDTYNLSDNVSISRIDTYSPVIRDLNIIQNKDKYAINGLDATFGLQLRNCKNAIIQNVDVDQAKYSSIHIDDCYNSKIIGCRASNCYLTGLGYGISITAASNKTVINGFVGDRCRHTITFGGNIGVPHNSIVSNTIGTAALGIYIFDTHKDCGNVIFNNCIAIGGVINEDRDRYKGVWDVAVTYYQTDIVTRGDALYELVTISSIGEDPLIDQDWRNYATGTYGFSINSDNATIINSQVINCYIGFNMASNTISGLIVNGLYCKNVRYGFNIYNSTLNNPYITNININNQSYKSGSYVLRFVQSSTINERLGDFDAINCGGVYLNAVSGSINIGKLSCYNEIVTLQSVPVDGLGVSFETINYFDDGINSVQNLLYQPNLKYLRINKLNADSVSQTLIRVIESTEEITINNINATAKTSMTSLMQVDAGDTLKKYIINNSSLSTSSPKPLMANLGTINKSFIGQLNGDFNIDYLTNRPILEIIQGEFDAPHISRGLGSPEAVVIADPGSSYYNTSGGTGTTFYIKESGTSNTGWVAK